MANEREAHTPVQRPRNPRSPNGADQRDSPPDADLWRSFLSSATPEAFFYGAKVTVVDRVVDAASGTFGVRLELPNPNYRLPAGLKCKVPFGR